MRDPKGAPSDFNIGTYTRTRVCHACDIAVPVSVNGKASKILGCSYCNGSRRLLKSSGKGRREMGSVFLPATGWDGENFTAVLQSRPLLRPEKLLAVFLLNAPSNIKVNIATNNSLSPAVAVAPFPDRVIRRGPHLEFSAPKAPAPEGKTSAIP